MVEVIFIHSAGPQGPGEGSHGLLQGLRAALPPDRVLSAPLMPEPDDPDAGRWIEACAKALADASGQVVLVGHSLGGSVLLQTLARHGLPGGLLGVVLLAAPFWGKAGWDSDSFALGPDDIAPLAGIRRLVVMQGSDDEMVAANHPDLYKALLPNVDIRRVPGVDHEATTAGPVLALVVEEVAAARA